MKFKRLNLAPWSVFIEQDFAGVQGVEILAIPLAVIIALAGRGGLEPGSEPIIDQQIQLIMHVGAPWCDPFGGVGGATHRADDVAGFDGLADFKAGPDLREDARKANKFQSRQ